jgi:N-acetylglucosamine-6-phosphate deacetylase
MSRRLLLEGLAGEPAAVLIDGDRIAGLGPELASVDDAERVACDGLRAVPGFLDLQVNGVADHDFTSQPASIWDAGMTLARHGVTGFLPTIVSSPRGTVEAALAAFAAAPAQPLGALPLGLHVEGPFISPVRRGAHDVRHLRAPELVELEGWAARGARIVTLAPELPGGLAAVERVASAGVVASVGHTDAGIDVARQAIDAGARMATHLFNAMPPLHHRVPGVVGALLDDERVTIGLIADGVHVDPVLLRLVARAAPGRIMLVSDAVAARLGDAELVGDDGSARLSDGTLAGSPHALDHGMRTFAAATGSVDAALAAVTSVPARLLGLSDGRGALRVGGRADLVLLDEDLQVAATLVGGLPAHPGERVAWPPISGGDGR